MPRLIRIARLLLVLFLGAYALACSKKSKAPTDPTPQPACSVSPTTLSFESVPVGGSSQTKSFAISNTGGGTLTGEISQSCADFEILSGFGFYSLTAGESRTVSVRFVPQSSGSKSCLQSTGCQQGVTLTGATAATPCELTPGSLDCGNVTVGQNDVRTFTLRHAGSATDTIAGTLTESCSEFEVLSPASYRLGGGQSASFTVRFSPSQAGPRSCTISTGSPGCATLPCTGTGIAVNADCQVTPAGLLFGDVPIGGSLDGTFTIRNAGSSRLAGFVSESCSEFSIQGQASYDLAAGASQSFTVRLAPTTQGSKSCSINTGTGCAALPVSGNGVVGCDVSPAALDFGYVKYGEVGYRTFTLSNNTNQQLTGNLIRADHFIPRTQSGSSSFSIAPHQSALIGVTFTPSASCDTSFYDQVIGTDTPICGQVQVRGIGTYGCDCTVSPTTIGFGDTPVGGTSGVVGVTIRNDSRASSTGAIRVLSGEFVVASSYLCRGNCQPCNTTVNVTFRPTRLGPQVGKILIEKPVGCLGPGAACDTVTATGTGVTVGTSGKN